jgi:hypothetical protein
MTPFDLHYSALKQVQRDGEAFSGDHNSESTERGSGYDRLAAVASGAPYDVTINTCSPCHESEACRLRNDTSQLQSYSRYRTTGGDGEGFVLL